MIREYCHFYYPAVVRRGALQIAISTEGQSPALAQRLRRELEAQFGPEYEPWLEWLGAARKFLRSEGKGSRRNEAAIASARERGNVREISCAKRERGN